MNALRALTARFPVLARRQGREAPAVELAPWESPEGQRDLADALAARPRPPRHCAEGYATTAPDYVPMHAAPEDEDR